MEFDQTQGLCVDIDDTICDTAFTTATLMAQEFGIPAGMTVEKLLAEDDQPGHVLHWKNTNAQIWLEAKLNDPSFLTTLPSIPTSASSLHAISTRIPITCYITSRLSLHREVTTDWLQVNGFPIAPILLREDDEHRVDWKLHYLQKKLGTTFGLIENDAKALESSVPYQGKRILYDRYQRRPHSAGIVCFSTWNAIRDWILATVTTVSPAALAMSK